ncbi:hypothetical protein INT43_009011 [Umbelopsis isabellina]|uniref:Uncharacterized protein n=1 Tax=Mortierella isabellina TaxID=91625 RepID=A0A8H7PWA3_MORIS|nr:hypothetical protein INT43_009011 [Umbelopsis isabellina]
MGAQASKQAARKFPQQANTVTVRQAPKASPSTIYHPENLQSAPTEQYIADDHRSQAIDEDGKDPDLAKKLAEIGQVNIPEFRTKYRQSDPMLKIIQQRNEVEKAEEYDPLLPSSRKAENRITIDDLFAVLEQRKLFTADRTDQQMQSISEKFGLDKESVQTLYKYVNSITPLDVGSDNERQRGVWVNSREQLDKYAEQANAIAKKREQARKADKAELAGDSQASAKSKKEKELEELFID